MFPIEVRVDGKPIDCITVWKVQPIYTKILLPKRSPSLWQREFKIKKLKNNKRLYVEQMKQIINRFLGPCFIYLIIYILGTGSDSKKINFYIYNFYNSGVPVKIEGKFITTYMNCF
jgi:hypothetical protein